MKKKISLITVSLLAIILGLWIFLSTLHPTTLPTNSLYYYLLRIFRPHAVLKKEVIGFLPYWRLTDVQYIHSELVGEINYFALYADNNGNIVKGTSAQPELSWYNWRSEKVKNLVAQTQILGGKFSLSIAVHKNKFIENILDNATAQQNLIDNIVSQATAYRLDAINIDFEYLGKPDKKYQQKFTKLIEELSNTLRSKSPQTKIYLSLAPLSARGTTLFDLPELNPFVDKYIGMSYDYYGASSDIAGPTAPIKGFKENKFFFDITTTYEDYLKYIPKEKIIMGIPYYGWDWAVEDGKKIQSKTFPDSDQKNYSATISYGRMREDKDLKPQNCKWDDYAQQSWCWYTDKNNIDHQVWFEDNKSITVKFDFARDKNLAGIAIWTLGFDNNYPDLWNLIKNKFTK
jgi:spore germination protein YaaH